MSVVELLRASLKEKDEEIEALTTELEFYKRRGIHHENNVSSASVVSEFTLDRNARQKIETIQQTGKEIEELKAEIVRLTEGIHKRDKMIKGLMKFVPAGGPEPSASMMLSMLENGNKELDNNVDDLSLNESNQAPAPLAEVINIHAQATVNMHNSLSMFELEEMRGSYEHFRRVTTNMFERLQATASFLERLMRKLEDNEDEGSQRLLAKIRALRLDLDVSMHETSVALEDAEKTEQSMSAFFERSVAASKDLHDKFTQPSLPAMIEPCNHEPIIERLNYDLTELKATHTEVQLMLETTTAKLKKAVEEKAALTEDLEVAQNDYRIASDQVTLLKDEMQTRVKELNEAIQEQKDLVSASKENNTLAKFVPEIEEELNRIFKCLTDVQKEVKSMPGLQRKAKTSKKP